MLFFILAVKAAEQSDFTINPRCWSRKTITRPVIYSLLSGIFLGAYLLAWEGAFLSVFIIFAYIIVQSVLDHLRQKHIDYLCFVGILMSLVALLIFLPSNPPQVYCVAMIIAVLAPVFLAAISWLLKRIDLKVGYYPLSLAGFGLVSMGILYLVTPAILKSLVGGFSIFMPSEGKLIILETQPLLFPGGQFSLSPVWSNFTTGFFISLIALGILVYQVVKRDEPGKALLLVWSLVLLAGTLAMRRIALLYAINVALLTGYLLWVVLKLLGLREKGGRLWQSQSDRREPGTKGDAKPTLG